MEEEKKFQQLFNFWSNYPTFTLSTIAFASRLTNLSPSKVIDWIENYELESGENLKVTPKKIDLRFVEMREKIPEIQEFLQKFEKNPIIIDTRIIKENDEINEEEEKEEEELIEYTPKKTKKRKKEDTLFTPKKKTLYKPFNDEQREILYSYYDKSNQITDHPIDEITDRTKLTPKQIKQWFYDRKKTKIHRPRKDSVISHDSNIEENKKVNESKEIIEIESPTNLIKESPVIERKNFHISEILDKTPKDEIVEVDKTPKDEIVEVDENELKELSDNEKGKNTSRTKKTEKQIFILEEYWNKSNKVSNEIAEDISNETGLPVSQVKDWFGYKKKRMKLKGKNTKKIVENTKNQELKKDELQEIPKSNENKELQKSSNRRNSRGFSEKQKDILNEYYESKEDLDDIIDDISEKTNLTLEQIRNWFKRQNNKKPFQNVDTIIEEESEPETPKTPNKKQKTPEQKKILEEYLNENDGKLKDKDLLNLCKKTGLKDSQVKKWFYDQSKKKKDYSKPKILKKKSNFKESEEDEKEEDEKEEETLIDSIDFVSCLRKKFK